MRLQAFWEARWILVFLALLAIVFGLLSAWALWFFVLLFLCTIGFFRDPERTPPVDPNIVVAAADGTVMDIVELDETEVLKNETMTWAFENPRVTIVVRQITGAIARRIVAWANIGDELKKGERFGMIRFGSRTELYLPLAATILVRVGDHVAGGATPIARLPNE